MRFNKYLEYSSVTSLFIGKIFLFFDHIVGWPFSTIGYILTMIFVFRKKLKIISVTIMGAAFTSGYGWYKWSHSITGLQTIDYIILICIVLFSIIMYVYEIIYAKNEYTHVQAIINIAGISGLLLLGYNLIIYGWICMVILHTISTVLYMKKKIGTYVMYQSFSLMIAVGKIISLLTLY